MKQIYDVKKKPGFRCNAQLKFKLCVFQVKVALSFLVKIFPKFKMFQIFFATPQICGIYSLNF